jgi:hypothetical protein
MPQHAVLGFEVFNHSNQLPVDGLGQEQEGGLEESQHRCWRNLFRGDSGRTALLCTPPRDRYPDT